MKKALLAASIVGVAAAGVILYLTRRNGAQRLMDGVNETVDEISEGAQEHGRRMASRLMREGRKKVNHIAHETME